MSDELAAVPTVRREFMLIICPRCGEHELRHGCLRCICPGCGEHFSRDNERPDDWTPEMYRANRYPTPGTRLRVAPVEEAPLPLVETTGTTARDDEEDVVRRVRLGVSLLQEGALARVLLRQRKGKIHCAMDCPDIKKLSAVGEEVGEINKAVHDEEGTLRLIAELLDGATASVAWVGYLVEGLSPALRRQVLSDIAAIRVKGDALADA